MLLTLAERIAPIFALIGIGWLLAWRGVFSSAALEAMGQMTVWTLVPATLLLTIAHADIGGVLDLRVWVAYYGAASLVWVAAYMLLRRRLRLPHDETVVLSFGSMFSNIGMFGIPVVDLLYGSVGLVVLSALVTFHAMLFLTAAIILLEGGKAERSGTLGSRIRATLLRALRGQLSNPIIVAILSGVALNLFQVGLPSPVEATLNVLRGALPPVALMLIGAGLYGQTLRGHLPTSGLCAVIKAVVLPLSVLLLGLALGVPMMLLAPAVMIAAMPPGVNPILLSAAYRIAVNRMATLMLFATLLALVTVPLFAVLLQTLQPHPIGG